MVSVVGDDLAGKTIRQGMMDINMVYNALHSNDGQLVVAVADMDIFQHLDPLKVSTILENDHPGLVCFDGNISSEMMLTIATTCKKLNVPAFFEPTSVPKSLRIFDHPETILSRSVHFISPNQFELEALSETAKMKLPKTKEDTALLDKRTPPLAQHVLPQALYLSNYIPNVITKLGEYGCLYVGRSESTRHIEYFPPEQIAPHEIKSVTGAGDW
ncbi:hypothetical protein DFQ30_005209 [Apophysomyces sp. BC1015]|nr:hypothetical protein DFQ30_005209 [Apophysomyces sp. BC1015]